jgi:hypothetical protein
MNSPHSCLPTTGLSPTAPRSNIIRQPNCYTGLSPPFMAMISMEPVEEDKTIEKLLQQPYEPSPSKVDIKPVAYVPCQTSNMFEQWWAVHDEEHWTYHQQNMEHKARLRDNGVWLYISEPNDYAYYSDPTTYSYDTPALVDYNTHSWYEEIDEEVELIDWYTTRMSERISLHPHECFMPDSRPASASTSHPSSDEDLQTGDTPDTTPPDSPCSLSAPVPHTDTEMTRKEYVDSYLSASCEAQVNDRGSRKRSASGVDSTALTTTAICAHEYETPHTHPLPTTPLRRLESIDTPKTADIVARLHSYAGDKPQTLHVPFEVCLSSVEDSHEAPQYSSSPAHFPSIEEVTYGYPHLLPNSSDSEYENCEKSPSNLGSTRIGVAPTQTPKLDNSEYGFLEPDTGAKADIAITSEMTHGNCDGQHVVPPPFQGTVEVEVNGAEDSMLYNYDFVDLRHTWYATLAENDSDEVEVPNEENEHFPYNNYAVRSCVTSESEKDTSSDSVGEFSEDRPVKTAPFEEQVLVPEAVTLAPMEEDVSTSKDDTHLIKGDAFEMMGGSKSRVLLTTQTFGSSYC